MKRLTDAKRGIASDSPQMVSVWKGLGVALVKDERQRHHRQTDKDEEHADADHDVAA